MSRLYAALVLVSIWLLGFIYLSRELKKLYERVSLRFDFHLQLRKYLASQGGDGEAAYGLIRDSPRMQRYMGGWGVMHGFRPPFANYMVQNWDIILNGLSAMRQAAEIGAVNVFFDYGRIVEESLIRYEGVLLESITSVTQQRGNPVVCFREGMRLLVSLPLSLLRSLGFSFVPELSALRTTRLVKLLAAISGLVTFLSSVVTVISGWETVSKSAKLGVEYLYRK